MSNLPSAPSGNQRPYRLIKGVSSLSDLKDGASAWSYPGDYPGRVYYVNNITGSSGNDGLSWDRPFAQVDQALLASETFRITHDTNNKMVRNVVYVQGTTTSYEKIDQDANAVDIIGIGNRALLGGAAGDAHIDGAGAADAMAMSDLVATWDSVIDKGGGMGVNVRNMHFATTGNYFAVDVETWLLSSFEDCYFLNNGANSYGGFRASLHFAGSLMRNCHAGGDSGSPQDGFTFTGGVFNQNLIEGNWACVRRYGLYTTDYLQGGTVIRNNHLWGGTYGIYDATAHTGLLGLAVYTDNRAFGSVAGLSIATGAARSSGNYANYGGTTTLYDGI